MKIEFDPQKNAVNFDKHGLRFEEVATLLDWPTAIFKTDARKNYGEERINAFIRGHDGKDYNIVFTVRDAAMRVISFRRAHEKERKRHEKNI